MGRTGLRLKRSLVGRVVLGYIAPVMLVGVALAGDPAEAQPVSEYRDVSLGYTLQPPAFPAPGAGQSVVAAMFLGPNLGGFSSNVSVMVQAVTTTPAEYKDLSLSQLKQAGWQLLSEEAVQVSGRDGFLWEYRGISDGRQLRWHALAVIDADRVYVVTSTANQEGFEAFREEFKRCIASFRLLNQ